MTKNTTTCMIDPLIDLDGSCQALALVELAELGPSSLHIFSDRERARYEGLGARRRRSYTAARLALKRVARKLAGVEAHLSDPEIETVAKDWVHPCCRYRGMPEPFRCSVAHNDRFAIAVADPELIGVDVETISPRLERGQRHFLKPDEVELIESASEDSRVLLTRIWTIKEAATKALDLTLPESWRRVQVIASGVLSSRLMIDDREVMASHARIDEHQFTVLRLSGWPPPGSAAGP